MKLALFCILCFFTITFTFLDIVISNATISTYYVYLFTYGDFLKNPVNLEIRYALYILLLTIINVCFFWYGLPFLFKSIKKSTFRNGALFVFSLFFAFHFFYTLKAFDILKAFLQKSYFYEEEYKAVEVSKITPPQTSKKNVILIFAESLEQSYTKPELFESNLLPKLSKTNGISFHNFEGFSGAETTVTAIVSSFCGVPVSPNLSIFKQNYSHYTFPKLSCLSDVLSEFDYENYFYFSSTEEYSTKKELLETHSFDKISGAESIRRNKNDEGFTDFLAVKDSRLFEFSKKKITDLQKSNENFFMVLLTANTHEPKGYFEPTCPAVYKDFRDIILCSDSQISDFIQFVQKTPRYKDTMIVVVGDHISRKNGVFNFLKKDKHRTVFNLFINAPTPNSLQRTFTSLDMAPTILEAIGFKLPAHTFGLGKSLYAPNKTLIEKYPKKELEDLIKKKSEIYEELLKEKEED